MAEKKRPKAESFFHTKALDVSGSDDEMARPKKADEAVKVLRVTARSRRPCGAALGLSAFLPRTAPVRTGEPLASRGRGRLQQDRVLSILCSQGDQFVFYEDWGENMVSKSTPVLCVLDVESGNVSVLEGVPESVSPGQVSADSAYTLLEAGRPARATGPCSHLPSGPLRRPSGPLGTQAWCS